MRVAIAHEWIDAYAGSEQVFEAIAQDFPEADLFALSSEPTVHLDLNGRPVTTSVLDKAYLRHRRGLTFPLMPLAWRLLGKQYFDLAISSHHSFAHANQLATGGTHLCYVHSPARYLWSPEIDQRGASPYLTPARAALKRVDLAASARVTGYAANSSEVATRIRKYWGRDSVVIPPPVRVEFFEAPSDVAPTRDYVLGVGRWIPYKNLHLVIEAADLAGLPVKIAGRGPDKSRIVAAAAAAKVPVEIIESPTDAELRHLYRNAACLAFPTVEDFGIVPVESQASGTPVVAVGQGGALDTIVPGSSGFLAETNQARDFAPLITQALDLNSKDCQMNARRFSRDAFSANIAAWVQSFVGSTA